MLCSWWIRQSYHSICWVIKISSIREKFRERTPKKSWKRFSRLCIIISGKPCVSNWFALIISHYNSLISKNFENYFFFISKTTKIFYLTLFPYHPLLSVPRSDDVVKMAPVIVPLTYKLLARQRQRLPKMPWLNKTIHDLVSALYMSEDNAKEVFKVRGSFKMLRQNFICADRTHVLRYRLY